MKKRVLVFAALFMLVASTVFGFETIRLIRATAADWTGWNRILAIGDVGYETDTGKFKFGDGNKAWTALAYASPAATGATTITTLGTIATGVWQGTAIADGYIASAATWNAKQNPITSSDVATAYTGSTSLVTAGSLTATNLYTSGSMTATVVSLVTGSANAIVCIASTGRLGICSGATGTSNSTCSTCTTP